MLGTLAIMGILSMAGIWAYNTAMDKLKANTIINEAQKRAVVIAGQIGLMGSTHPTLGEFKENTFGGGTFGTQVTVNGLYNQFGIQVAGVPKTVCQNILNSIEEGTAIRRISTSDDPRTALTNCADTNTFLMIYNNDLSTASGDTQYCQTDSFCQTVCGTCNLITHLCENDCDIPEIAGGCDFDSECNADNKCMICNAETRQCEDGCQLVEYLESTGTQYIDTGVVPKSTTGINIDYAYTNISGSVSAGICGTYQSNTPRTDALFITTNSGMTNSTVFLIHAGNSIQANTPTLNTFYNAKINWLNNGKLNFNGSVTGDIGTNQPNTTPIRLFSRYKVADGSYAYTQAKIKKCQFSENGQIIHDFIPVHAPFQPAGKQNCMYDRVSKTLFCNQGTGDDFIIPSSN